jgi:histidinol-phosphate aminotransferase
MVNVGKDVTAVAEEFKKRKVLVGRKFPPMNNWLRVSVGTGPEMARFISSFKEIFPAGGVKTPKKEAAKAAGA